MIELVLLRHGESVWNRENRFTGWTDVDLTPRGEEEARRAGRLLAEAGHTFDVACTSLLKRAIRTLWIVLGEMDLAWIPVHRSWRLNERHYGALQGLDKAQTAAEYGDAQVLVWRRSYSTPPPALAPGDERHPRGDPRYAALGDAELPLTECLEDTVARFLPFWRERIVPELGAGRRVLIAAHGNTLRALVKHLDGVPDDEIVHLDIPTGVPLVYRLDDDLNAISHEYLGDPDEVRRAMESVAAQGKAKGKAGGDRRRGRPAIPSRGIADAPAGAGDRPEEISFDDFLKVEIVTGTIVGVRANEKARVPAFVIDVDFGPYGRRTSSAQLTGNYTPETLKGRQIVAVANFPPKRVAGVKSEVLILGAVSEARGVVLLEPTFPVENGARIA